MIDLHTHILPGVDDGSRSLDESLKMAKAAERDGVETIVATPHLFRHSFVQTDLSLLREKWVGLASAVVKQGIQVEILLGAEVHFVHDFYDELKRNYQYLVLNKGSYVIVEFPSHHIFSGVRELFFKLISQGTNLIVAHPERNSHFMHQPDLFYELIKLGAYAQANSGSFSGLYGREVKETATRFLECNLYHFLASDSHGKYERETRLSRAYHKVKEKAGEDQAAALVIDNPEAALKGKNLPFWREPLNPVKKKRALLFRIPLSFK